MCKAEQSISATADPGTQEAIATTFPCAMAMSARFTPPSSTTEPFRRIRSNSAIPGRQSFDKANHRFQRFTDVRLAREFFRMMTDSAPAANEEHRDGTELGESRGIVSSTAGE